MTSSIIAVPFNSIKFVYLMYLVYLMYVMYVMYVLRELPAASVILEMRAREG